ncbi:conserved hypothetical protein [Candidatus Jettenia caeni]|uniref:Transposase n=1 Tax=Candidatus Jettenia caeni TaxID=247490 RepID=I3IH93_9BACT|nr:hypothetical protein [Candidatus Jettenia sp. AMX1]NUN23291.1 hypothetical protein [Candidatus Jettenia caeni]WKZ16417.1 MAG: hypothetical protein QY317_03725 [Candidatus Jettenia caeni]GAB61088.1 conserved hypothetical protein [Candidatus Jettenia caeni]GIL19818.1 MAG: hypothetical protein BroJett041_09320 [Candidatus Jettenia caeni]GJQ46933.1 MAG: hypothetical protein JETCAE04_26870 [Candidatus Jettenia caeni]
MSRIARVVVPEVPHHITQRGNRRSQILEVFGKWDDFLSRDLSDEEAKKFRCHERTGRPLGADNFIAWLENVLGRMLHKQKSAISFGVAGAACRGR